MEETMFDKLKDMGQLAKKAKEMKDKMKQIQQELKTIVISLDEGDIKVDINGEMELLSVAISETLLTSNSKADLEKKLLKVINKATRQAKSTASSKLSAVSKGLNIPGLS
jgi:DNA-binding YbaB/EbfC family protein